jgi:hypothetical protein
MSKKKKTLCKWDKGEIKEDFERLGRIVSRPRFVCRDCARAASKKKWLCQPRAFG